MSEQLIDINFIFNSVTPDIPVQPDTPADNIFSAVVNTGNNLFFVAGLILLIILLSAIFILGGGYLKSNNSLNANKIYKDTFIVPVGIKKIAIGMICAVLACTGILIFSNIAFAVKPSNENLIETPSSINVWVDEDAQTVKFDNSWFKNISDKNLIVEESNFAITSPAQELADLSNVEITMYGLDGVIYQGLPYLGENYTPKNLSALPVGETSDVFFDVVNLSVDNARKLIGQNVFSLKLKFRDNKIDKPVPKQGLIYNGQEQTGVEEGVGYELSETLKATDAGEYSATATLISGYIWSDGTSSSATINWEIEKAPSNLHVAPSSIDKIIRSLSKSCDITSNSPGDISSSESTEFLTIKINENKLTLTGKKATSNKQIIQVSQAATKNYNFASVDVEVDKIIENLKEIKITNKPTKTDYFVGDAFETDGMIVTAFYYYGKPQDVSVSIKWSPEKFDAPGDEVPVSISYEENGFTATTEQIVKVVPKLTDITITQKPSKIEYNVGESFDKKGMVVIASYNYGESHEVSDFIKWSPEKFDVPGDEVLVDISYEENGVPAATKQSVKVNKITNTLSLSPKSCDSMKIDDTVEIIVSSDVDSEGAISVVDTDYLSGTVKGNKITVQALKASEQPQEITISQAETAYYTSAKATFTVNKIKGNDAKPYACEVKTTSEDDTLEFRYDNLYDDYSYVYDIPDKSTSVPGWKNKKFQYVNFDESFKNYTPKICRQWFKDQEQLLSIKDIKNLNTTDVIDMSEMFSGCSILNELDISNFDITSLKNSEYMFNGCETLEHIFCDNNWSESTTLTTSTGMFDGCKELNHYGDSSQTQQEHDITFAYPDNGLSGFFTPVNPIMILNEFVGGHYENPEGEQITSIQGEYNSEVKVKIVIDDASMALISVHDNTQNTYPINEGVISVGLLFNGSISVYISPKAAKVYACETKTKSAGDTLEFRYDNLYDSYTVTYDIPDGSGIEPEWINKKFKYANFDERFKSFKPNSCYYWFKNQKDLREIKNIGNLDTSDAISFCSMFWGCSSLESLDITNFKTEKVTDMSYMFVGCPKLKNIDFSGIDTSNVENMKSMFNNCSSLTTLDITKLNTGKVTDMNSIFWGCSKVSELDLSKLDTKNVTDMSNMFRECSSLTKLDLSHLDTPSLQYMCSMFYGCSSLSTLDVSPLKTHKVLDMSSMFQSCSKLTKLDISNFNTSKVLKMASMFNGCSSLAELNLTGIDTSKVDSMSAMFSNCEKLASLNLSGFNTSDVNDMSYMFNRCISLQSADVSNFDTTSVANMSYMFNNCVNLSSINVSKFNTKKVTNMRSMFESCASMSELNVANFETEKVADMSYMFKSCSKIATLNVSNFNTENVSNMNSMFYGCSTLTKLNVSNFNTSKVTDMRLMFSSCKKLTDLDLSSFNTQNVTDMDSMFNTCVLLKNVKFSENFITESTTNMSSMFSGCLSIQALDLSSFSCSNTSVVYGLFYGCNSLSKVTLSSKWKVTLDWATLPSTKSWFDNCNGLEYSNVKSIPVGVDATYVDDTQAFPYAASKDGTLYFKNDDKRSTLKQSGWSVYYLNSEDQVPSWKDDGCTKAVFEKSFKNCKPISCKEWFAGRFDIISGDYRYKKISNLEYLDTSQVKTMQRMFKQIDISELDLSTFDTSNVTDMCYMFDGSFNLENLNVSQFKTSNVETMNEMFSECKSLKKLDLSGWDISKVVNTNFMFLKCSQLSYIYCNSDWSISAKLVYSDSMFQDCIQLKNYDEDYTDKTYAYPYNGTTGYFTPTTPSKKCDTVAVPAKNVDMDTTNVNVENVENNKNIPKFSTLQEDMIYTEDKKQYLFSSNLQKPITIKKYYSHAYASG